MLMVLQINYYLVLSRFRGLRVTYRRALDWKIGFIARYTFT
jgi:hypothetical protein